MNLPLLIIIIFASFILAAICLVIDSSSDLVHGAASLFFAICVFSIIWACIAGTSLQQKEKFVYKIPVLVYDRIAISVHKSELINCTEKFKIQFTSGDSICVFQEKDTWIAGVKFDGGKYIFKTDNK